MSAPGTKPWAKGALRISRNGRNFELADGSPFFLMGDTAWEMIHLAAKPEVETYLALRAKQGFNTVLTVAVAELDGFKKPNHAGHTPFDGTDFSKPNEAYWQHVDAVIEMAEKHGIHIGLLPIWGTWVDLGMLHDGNAFAYGAWIGARYTGRPNLIWILGGDLDFKGANGEHRSTFCKLAAGIRSQDQNHLMGYHPKTRSGAFAHQEPWLDFNMFQTSHHRADNPDSYRWVEADRALIPAKPTMDGEPRYEGHPVNWKTENRRFNDFDVRQAAYWSALSGAAGHIYGHISVIAWKHPGLSPLPWYLPASVPDWQEAIVAPGAQDMEYLCRFMEWVDPRKLVPDQTLIRSENPHDGGQVRAARGDGVLLVYTPFGRSFELDLSVLGEGEFRCQWQNPRSGEWANCFERASDLQSFDPPGPAERGDDWLLCCTKVPRDQP